MNNEAVILQMKDMRKSFDHMVALNNVNFELNSREIHGLLGGNGAGKTTLMNVLYGLYKEDAGEIFLHGRKINVNSPKSAIQFGIGMVHQHFLQINNFSVIQNVVLGTSIKKQYSLNLDFETQKVKELCERFAIDVDPYALVGDLPMGTRQKVEILKALYRGIEILILDEPTTNLTPQEVDGLFQTLRVMVDVGLSIVFITHKLREVLSVCDRITVLRDGRKITTMKRSEASEEKLVWDMVGEDLDVNKSVIFSKGILDANLAKVGTKPILEVDGVKVISAEGNIELIKNISFTLHENEVLGIAGVAGNGQHELAEVLVGVRQKTEGKIRFAGEEVKMETSTLLAKGITYIPEDRLEDGYLPKANLAQNLILGSQRQEPYSKNGFINWKTVFNVAKEIIGEYNIKTKGPGDLAGNLSGGNIQRVMIARAFSQRGTKLLVLHNPNRGLDIRSMDFVYKKILELKNRGVATLLLSEDLDELLLICDRIGVMYRGEIVGTLNREQFEKYEIGRMMSGVKTAN